MASDAGRGTAPGGGGEAAAQGPGPGGWRPTLWEEVLDEVLSGLLHELNGRVAGLDGVFSLIGTEGMDEELRSMAEEELAALREVAPLLRSLPRRPSRAPEAFRLAALARPMAALARRRRGGGDAAVEIRESDPAPVVQGDWNGWSRLLLTLITLACRAADPSRGTVSVRCERRHDEVGLILEARKGDAGSAGAAQTAGSARLEEDRVEEARAMAAALGCRLRTAADPATGGTRWEISYPSAG